jgi:hypothetical protein
VPGYHAGMKVMSVACTVAGVSVLMGCSLLYNPNNLPPLPIDAAVDATGVLPDLLAITAVGPLVLLEGQGTGGSRPAILAIEGNNIASDATVTLVPVDAQGAAPVIEVDNAHAVHALGGTVLAVPVTLPVDPNRGKPNAIDVMLTVQVTQMGASGTPVVVPLAGKLTLRNLPELDTAITEVTALASRYSQVSVSAGLSFTAHANASPVVIRAVGAIDFGMGDVHVDALGQTPGPGGNAGGAKGANGGGAGGGRPSGLLSGGLLAAASGGGYGTAGTPGGAVGNANATPGGLATGDDFLKSYPTNASSGGGGGDNNPGGGGGGTLELTAGGTLTVGKVSANGGSAGGNAGGGSGGAILLRSGANATLGAITANGGSGGGSGGGGGVGRVRYDVLSLAGTAPPGARRGVVFDPSGGNIPLATNDAHQPLRVVSTTGATDYKVFVLNKDGTTTASTTVTFGSSSAVITPTLVLGYNRICVTPPGSTPDIVESTNCLDIAYVP